jgi:hypothetical protein
MGGSLVQPIDPWLITYEQEFESSIRHSLLFQLKISCIRFHLLFEATHEGEF